VAEIAAVGIVKRYDGLVANDGVDLSAERGEIHGVMGENGAGKTTLMSILFGLQSPDAGEIRLRDAPVRFRSPIDAMAAGLGMVHQSFKLFGSLTAWENIVYGAEPKRGPFIDRRAARERVAELAERHHLAVEPDARVADLSVGVRQRIEILKALHRDARILILDEPTAVLTPSERDALFAVLKSLASEGRTVLFVTHKLHEVTAITDRVTILRDGRAVASLRTADTNAGEIVRAMTGRNVNLKVKKRLLEPSDPLLKAVDVTIASPSGKLAVDRVSLTVWGGEIVGIAGVAGNGQNELVEALVGLRNPDGGRVEVCGRDVTDADVAPRRRPRLYP
jgi:general nucleoside transport system ATP-binding protein